MRGHRPLRARASAGRWRVMRANAGRGHIASAGEGVVVGACKRTALVANASEGALVGACAGTVRLRARAR